MMSAVFRAALCLILLAMPAWGNLLLTGVASGPAYIGPGDRYSTSVLFFGGFQAWSAATAGTKAVNVCNSTGGVDVACTDWSTSASTGLIVPALISGFNCAGVTVCTVKTIYNQSGGSGSDAVGPASIPDRATVLSNCLGTQPCISFAGNNSYVVTISAIPMPISFSSVYEVASGNTSTIVGDTGASPVLFVRGGVPDIQLSNGVNGFGAAATVNAWHAVEAVANVASSYIYLDATETTGTVGPSSTGTTITLFKGEFGQDAGFYENVGIWASAMPDSTAALICHDAFLLWGTSTSC
jgi:hypothetical protein